MSNNLTSNRMLATLTKPPIENLARPLSIFLFTILYLSNFLLDC